MTALSKKNTFNTVKQGGQAFVEVIVVVGLTIIIVSVLISSTVNGLKSSNFSSSKSLATTLAKEGIELARKERDASWYAFAGRQNQTWCVDKAGVWTVGPSCPVNIVNSDNTRFTRTVTLNWNATSSQMQVVSKVTWQDGAELRESEITTLFTQWR